MSQFPGGTGLPTPPTGGSSNTPINPSRPPEDLSQDRLLTILPRGPQGHPMLGRLPLLARIGKGGMGSVYYSIHPRLQVEVAVKILPFTLVDEEPKLIERFFSEARMAASLASEHVVRVLDVDHDSSTYFLVMEYVDGESAGGYLKRAKSAGRPALAEPEALDIMTAAARGLAAAHERGIIHRDIKPDNILIPRGQLRKAKLADLGLAKPEGNAQSLGTASHIAMGTPGYMAPEQIEDAKNAGPPADVFSMGATLYALLGGRAPFAGSSVGVVLRDTATKPHAPLPQSVSAATRAIVDRCLQKDPAKRYANGAALLAALDGRAQPAPVMEPTLMPLPQQRERRSPAAAIAVLLLLLAAGGVAAWYVMRSDAEAPTPPVATDDAERRAEEAKRRAEEERRAKEAEEAKRAKELEEEKIRAAAKSVEEKRRSYRDLFQTADMAKTIAEAKDSSQGWQAVVDGAAKAEAYAQDDAEKAAVRELSMLAQQRRDWAGAREAESRGDIPAALDLAGKAAGARTPPKELADYKAALEGKKREIDRLAQRKKDFETWAGQARGEKDGASALALWKRAQDFADDAKDKEEARAQIERLAGGLQRADLERQYRELLKAGSELLSKGDEDGAEAKFREASRVPGVDGKEAADGLWRVAESRTSRTYADAIKEGAAAAKAGEWEKAKAAYDKALKAKAGDGAAQAGLAEVAKHLKPARIEIALAANVKMEFALIRAGAFTMGDPAGTADERPHRVTITKDFWMQTTETTQAQWEAAMGSNPSATKGADRPVESVSWEECAAFADKVSAIAKDRKASLPTEAEWEYAARAGKQTPWHFGDDVAKLGDYAWYLNNAGRQTHAVAQKKPNEWGLYDMYGNVWEWCSDWYGLYGGDATDPAGPGTGVERVERGGGWDFFGPNCRSGYRTKDRPTFRSKATGCRLVIR